MVHDEAVDSVNDRWEGGFLLDRPLRAVSAGGGLVVAGGDALHMLRPGAVRAAFREASPLLVAVEPWAPFRYAATSRGRLEVFSGREPDEQLLVLQFSDPGVEPTHLAWRRQGGESALYFRGKDSQVGRVRLREHAFEYVEAPPVVAIASDASGVLALLSLVAGEEDALVSCEGGGFEARPLSGIIPEVDPAEDHVYLAVSGRAVAYSVNEFGTSVSWAEEELFEYCGGLMWGPIAFQGDDALFCAYSVERKSSVLRRTRQGAVSRVAEIETHAGPPPTIAALAWDESRKTLWGASPELGWLASKQGMSKGEAGRLLS